MTALFDWIRSHEALMAWMGLLSAVTFVGTLALIPWLIVRIPDDYFAQRKPPPERWSAGHPVLRWTVLIVKNVLGAAFVLVGLALLVLPGQGILTVLVGVMLLNFPGKRWLEFRIMRMPKVLRAVNWIRRRAKRPPLVVNDGSSSDEPNGSERESG